MYIQGKSEKVMIHFHANGEDIGMTENLMTKISLKLNMNIICMEYPGYGIYTDYSFDNNTT